MLGTNPIRTHDQSRLYLEVVETMLDLYSHKGFGPSSQNFCAFYSSNTVCPETPEFSYGKFWPVTRFRFQTIRETVALPALKKILWIFSLKLPGGLALKNGGEFW